MQLLGGREGGGGAFCNDNITVVHAKSSFLGQTSNSTQYPYNAQSLAR